MRMLSILFSLVLALPAGALSAAEYPPADHGGSDLVLQSGDLIWGVHTGVQTLTVVTSATVHVAPFDGSTTSGRGLLEIHAEHYDIGGTIDATGAGYTGGGGGGGGASFGGVVTFCYSGPGKGGRADYGDDFHGTDGALEPFDPGSGGQGDGSFGGTTSSACLDGGYAAPCANGDISVDDSTAMGSGGAGSTGGYGGTENYPCPVQAAPETTETETAAPEAESRDERVHNGTCVSCYSGVGGAAGGRGGGTIRLVATGSFRLRNGALLDASGVLGGAHTHWTWGGDVSPPGAGLNGAGAQTGGAGAGGGILLHLEDATTVSLEQGGTIRSLGGHKTGSNGGTVKLRLPAATPPVLHTAIQAPRICTGEACYSRVGRWKEY